MINNKCWRTPTPTDIRQCDSIDILSRMLFLEIINGCQNQDYLSHFIHNEKHFSVELKRGQCILKVQQIAKKLKMGRKKVRKSLETVSKWYTPMDIKRKPYGLIITLLEYDELIQMDSTGTIQGQQRNSRGTPNKSIKSKKNDKNIPPKEKKYSETDWEIAKQLSHFLTSCNSALKKKWTADVDTHRKHVAKWAEDINELVRIDKADHKQISDVLKWIFTNDSRDSLFWRGNIQSGATLRKQFSRLVGKIESVPSSSQPIKWEEPTLPDKYKKNE